MSAGSMDAEYIADTLTDRIMYAAQGWGTLGLNTAVRPKHRAPSKLRIKDSHYDRGLGMHAVRYARTWRCKTDRTVLRLRHPTAKPIRSVRIDGEHARNFDPSKETVALKPQESPIEADVAY